MDVDELREAATKATPGPWDDRGDGHVGTVTAEGMIFDVFGARYEAHAHYSPRLPRPHPCPAGPGSGTGGGAGRAIYVADDYCARSPQAVWTRFAELDAARLAEQPKEPQP